MCFATEPTDMSREMNELTIRCGNFPPYFAKGPLCPQILAVLLTSGLIPDQHLQIVKGLFQAQHW